MKTTNGEVDLAWEHTGKGDPLLLIHGLGYGRWGWGRFRDHLAENYTVISFDNRGIGESSVPPGPYTATAMASDALAVLAAAGVERAHVAGTSLGGMIAQELAIDNPERVDRLVLMSTTPGRPHGLPMPEHTARLIGEAANMTPAVALRRFVENALGAKPNQDLVDEIMGLRLGNVQDPDGWQAQAAAGTGYESGGRTEAITAPTLVMSGTHDNVVDHRNAMLLADLIDDAALELYDGLGHLMFWEDPEGVASRIRGFLG